MALPAQNQGQQILQTDEGIIFIINMNLLSTLAEEPLAAGWREVIFPQEWG